MPQGARLCGPLSGSVACAGRSSNALKKRKRSWAWPSMKCANTPAGTTICSRRCWRTSFCGTWSCTLGKKAPALTVSQLRTILEVVLPLRRYTSEEVLAFIAWVQQRNHQAYRAHRARHQEDG